MNLLYILLFLSSVSARFFQVANSSEFPSFNGATLPYTSSFDTPQEFNTFIADIAAFNGSNSALNALAIANTGCANLDWSQIQYKETIFLYAALLDVPADMQHVAVLPVCSSTCSAASNSFQAALNSPSQCSAAPSVSQAAFRTSMTTKFTLVCASSQTTNCFGGTLAESTKCGFGSLASAQAFCTTSSNACCTTVVKPAVSTTVTSSTTPSASSTSIPTPNDIQTESLLNWRLIVGLVVGFVGLLILIALFMFFVWRRDNKKKGEEVMDATSSFTLGTPISDFVPLPMPVSPLQSLQTVAYPYVANLALGDELSLHAGDRVIVVKQYADDWAHGKNITTDKEGMFPLTCLRGHGSESSVGQRTSSHIQRDSLDTV